ncbi:MAG: thioredoxin [Paludibacteraceae bacterium]|nr:thioredoxin [Paludibacteraceae bacterium]MBN2786856.1 thioredoxin [Paludibacteraceae bacterium]
MATTVTDGNFAELISSNKVLVIDFSAEWCGPCKQMEPIIDGLVIDYEGKALIGKVDVDENPEVCEKYGIRNIPTILLFKNGDVADRIVGATPKNILEDKIKGLL